MAKIERYGAPGVCEPATYSQGVKVTESKAVLFIAGQVAYDKDGAVCASRHFKGQARDAFKAIKALVEAQGGTLTMSSSSTPTSPTCAIEA
jgi:enamine deaminase RidA (YjgF/YER057c/UK114 family)